MSSGLAFAGSSSMSVRLRSLFVVGLRLDPGDGILPCTTVTELIDLRDVDRSPSVCRYLCGSRPAGQAFLTEMSQSCRGVRIRLDFCRKGRIAMCVGQWIWLPADALRARPAICGALDRASVNSDAANQQSPIPWTLCSPQSPRPGVNAPFYLTLLRITDKKEAPKAIASIITTNSNIKNYLKINNYNVCLNVLLKTFYGVRCDLCTSRSESLSMMCSPKSKAVRDVTSTEELFDGFDHYYQST
jgi:hypothetical protein